MKMCVIGGSGFVGSRLVERLLCLNHEVVIFDKRPSRIHPDLVVFGDVRDAQAIEKVLADCDVVYNLAAEHRDDVRPISLYYDVNVEGARNISKACTRHGIRRIIFTSSVAVYGLKQKNPTEKSPANPFNHYGKSKAQAEEVLHEWAREDDGRSLTVVRPCVIFGEGNRGNVYNLIKQIENNHFFMVGRGNNRKSMAYVGNVAEFLTATLKFDAGIHTFNYSDKPDMTTNDLVALVRSQLGIIGSLYRIPYMLGLAGGLAYDLLSILTSRRYPVSSVRIRKFCADTIIATNAIEELGFNPPFTLEEGLQRMIANIDQEIYFDGER